MPKRNTKVHAGYPREFIFSCREDVDAYLGGDRIECLLCGNQYQILEPHLISFHKIDGDDYREKFGLPYKRGLTSGKYTARRSELAREMFEENRERQLAFLASAKAVQAVNGNPQRGKPKFWKRERTEYTGEIFEEFIKRVIGGRTITDVQTDPDMPTIQHVYWYMKRDKKFSDKYRALIPLFARPGLSHADRVKQGLVGKEYGNAP